MPSVDDGSWLPTDGLKDLHVYEVIGAGKYSKVHKIRKKKTIRYFALKISEKSQRQRLLREVRALHALDHGNIIKFYMWYETKNHLWTVSEYCVGGNLSSLLQADGRLPEASVHHFGRALATALQFLHSKSILHCDLQPANILLDENGQVKLAGFGFARTLLESTTKDMEMSDVRCYLAPEVVAGDAPCSFASDLWALGCILYEMVAGHPPFQTTASRDAEYAIVNSNPKPLPGASPELQDVVDGLLAKDPLDRLDWEGLRQHSFWQTPLATLQLPEQPGAATATPKKPRASQRLSAQSSSGNGSTQASSRAASGESDVDDEDTGSAPHDALDEGDELPPNRESSFLSTSRARDEERMMSPLQATGSGRSSGNGIGLARCKTGAILQSQDAAGKQHSGTPAPLADAVNSGDQAGLELLEELQSLSQLLWHPSDSVVKPIVQGKRADKSSSIRRTALSFFPLAWEQLEASTPAECRRFVADVHDALTSETTDKAALLEYLEGVCGSTKVANLLINSRLAGGLVATLRKSTLPSVRMRAAAVLGLLIRHATCIEPSFSKSGVVEVLVSALPGENDRVKRKLMATLGELLFFVASQEKDTGPDESWQVPHRVAEVVCSMLDEGQDEGVQLNALKTIENVASSDSRWARRFACRASVTSAIRIMRKGSGESARVSAAWTLCRLLRVSDDMLAFFEQGGGVECLLPGLFETGSKMHLACLNMLCLVLTQPKLSGSTLAFLQEDGWTEALHGSLQSTHAVARGKAFLAFALAMCRFPGSASRTATAAVATQALKAEKEEDEFLACCASAYLDTLPTMFSGVLHQVHEGGEAAVLALEAAVNLISSSSATCLRVVSDDTLRALAGMVDAPQLHLASPDLRAALLSCCEACCASHEALARHVAVWTEELLPALAGNLAAHTAAPDTRFSCIHLLCGLLPRLMLPAAEDPRLAAELRAAAVEVVERHVLPHVPAVLGDEDPMPLHMLKLLASLLEIHPVWSHALGQLGVASTCLSFLALDNPNNRVSNIHVCRALLEQGAVSRDECRRQKVATKAIEILQYAVENAAEIFMEPSLHLCLCLIHAAGLVEAHAMEPAMPVFLQLCLSELPHVAMAAAECLTTLAEACPEAAGRLLAAPTAMRHLGRIFESRSSLREGEATLDVQRRVLGALPAMFPVPNATGEEPGGYRELCDGIMERAASFQRDGLEEEADLAAAVLDAIDGMLPAK